MFWQSLLTLVGLKKIQSVDFSNNRLDFLQSTIFEPIASLQVLRLSKNQLVTVSQLRMSTDNLQVLRIDNNKVSRKSA